MKSNFTLLKKVIGAFVMCLAVVFSPSAVAGPPSAVTKVQSAAAILVTVPANGKAVTYVLGDKIWTVKPGQTVVLPVGATKINLPAGTILTSSVPSSKSMEPTKQPYTVNRPIVLGSLTPTSIKANGEFFTPGAGVGGSGINLPSATITDLINAVSSASGTTVNPFNVLEEDVTDGN